MATKFCFLNASLGSPLEGHPSLFLHVIGHFRERASFPQFRGPLFVFSWMLAMQLCCFASSAHTPPTTLLLRKVHECDGGAG